MAVAMPETEVGPLDYTRKFAGGIRADIARRAKIYKSDWTDAFTGDNTMKTTSSILFLFFACLSPAIAFGLLFQDMCGGSFGVVETIMSSALAGIIWALLSGQPLCILGATGPVLAYTAVCYNLYKNMFGKEFFFALYLWTGLWFSFFTVVMAAADVCCIVRQVTKFTEEIFSALISVIFIVEALKPTVLNFHSGKYDNDSAFLQAILTLGTYMLATKLASLKNTNLLNFIARKVLSSFGVTIAILVMSGFAAIWARPVDEFGKYGAIKIPFLDVPAEIQPTFQIDGVPRPWFINPVPEGMPIWAIFFTIVPAAGFAVLGFLDQNLTTLLINRKSNGLKKPPGYHLDLLIRGLIIHPICAIFGLPFPVAATVRSLAHLISLTNYEIVEVEGGGARKVPVNVVEQRVTNLGIHVLMGLSLVLSFLLKFVPKPVLLGVFLFMGISSMVGNELFERLFLWAIFDSSKYPKYPYVTKVTAGHMHKFTFLQVLCLGILYALKEIKSVAVLFPFFIASLVLIRWSFNKIFTAEELEALDGHGEEDEVHNEDPDSPLKRTANPVADTVQPATQAELEKGVSPRKEEMPRILGRTAPTDEDKKPEGFAQSV